jgi:metal-responsive CopG/Arc/MetJ family transcriptional regulator
MARAVKVTVSLPETLHSQAERERKARKENRSQFFRGAIEALLKQRQEQAAAERYIQGYLEQPETAAEVAASQAASAAALAAEPWE